MAAIDNARDRVARTFGSFQKLMSFAVMSQEFRFPTRAVRAGAGRFPDVRGQVQRGVFIIN
jgi:hypothetical protein